MPVTIYQDDYFGGYDRYFRGNASTPVLSYYSMNAGPTWNDQVSSLYTSEYLKVFEDAGYAGNYAVLPPGCHTLASLSYHGVDNDSISSFYTLFRTLPA